MLLIGSGSPGGRPELRLRQRRYRMKIDPQLSGRFHRQPVSPVLDQYAFFRILTAVDKHGIPGSQAVQVDIKRDIFRIRTGQHIIIGTRAAPQFFSVPEAEDIKKRWQEHTAAAAKLLQLCLTLSYPIDDSPPGCPVPEILQARTLGWVATSFSSARK